METKEVISTLNKLIVSGKLDVKELNAVVEATSYLAKTEHKDNDGATFQEWPFEAATMKDLRTFIRDHGSLDDDTKILVLQDDGMGYGANNGYCNGLYVSQGEDEKNEVQIWF